MPFRDKDVALRSQVSDLEDQNAALRAENEQLKTTGAVVTRSTPRVVWFSLGVGFLLAAAASVSTYAVGGSTGETVAVVMVPLVALAWTCAAVLLTLSRLLYVATPNEVLVISGRRVIAADGSERGYRLVRGGRALKLPMLEQVDRMDLSAMSFEVTLENAFAKGGIVDVTAHAVARIAANEPLLNNAVERFLGQERHLVMNVALQTLEGALRGVVATLTVDELCGDQLKVADAVLHEAEHEFSKLGLELDVFKIARVDARGAS